MGLSSVHPLYEKFRDIWEKLDHVFEGQEKIKDETFKYLPALPSMLLDGMGTDELGYQKYQNYILRANFPDNFAEAVRNNHGLLWSKPATINLPKSMEYLKTSATKNGLSLESLMSLINEMQLRNGRIGLLLDLDSNPSPDNVPFISVYYAKDIRNWDVADGGNRVSKDALNMLVLDESKAVRTAGGFDWQQEQRYRYLRLGPLDVNDAEDGDVYYSQGLFIEQDDPTDEDMVQPVYRGTRLNKIPFVCINSSDTMIEPDQPPLLGLANLVLSMYISDADYRQHLYLQSQDTLVRIGAMGEGEDGKAPTRVGAGALIDVAMGGDVKYVGVQSQGLSEERLAIAADKQEAQLKAGNMVNNTQGSQESGEALRTRIGARTASLVHLAKTGAAGLEKLLKICAEWMGADPDEVSVQPNLDFSKAVFSGQNLVQTMAARNLGAPVSLESIHAYLVDQGVTKMTFEDEMKRVEAELKKWPIPGDASADQNPVQQVQGGQINSGGAGQQPQNSSGQS